MLTVALILSLLAYGVWTIDQALDELDNQPSWAEGYDLFWDREEDWLLSNQIVPGLDICEHEKLSEGHA